MKDSIFLFMILQMFDTFYTSAVAHTDTTFPTFFRLSDLLDADAMYLMGGEL